MLGLDPDSVINRIKAGNESFTLPTLNQSVLTGAIGFTIVSILMYGTWAVGGRWLIGKLHEPGFYAVLAVGFMAGGGGAYAPNVIGRNLGRFYVLFVGSFLVYATVWSLCWFLLGKIGFWREWIASVLSPAVMGLIFVFVFEAGKQLPRVLLAMIVGHTLGYFSGEWLYYWEPLNNQFGMILWGVTYGLGFGAGIAAMLYWCQSESRERLLAISRAPGSTGAGTATSSG